MKKLSVISMVAGSLLALSASHNTALANTNDGLAYKDKASNVENGAQNIQGKGKINRKRGYDGSSGGTSGG
ncbi:hypothetical protein BH10PSE19_BH10PSE19_05340 [soil metagenome]